MVLQRLPRARPTAVAAGQHSKNLSSAVEARAILTCAGQPEDLANTTLFIGALSSSVTEEELKGLFGRFGPIVYCKIPTGGSAPKNCAFVQYVSRPSAEQAMQEMHGQVRILPTITQSR